MGIFRPVAICYIVAAKWRQLQMKKLIFLLLVSVSATLYAQTSTLKMYRSTDQSKVSAEVVINYAPRAYDKQIFIEMAAKVNVLSGSGYKYNGKVYQPNDIPGLAVLLDKLGGQTPTVTVKVYYKSIPKGSYNVMINNTGLGLLGDGIYIKNCTPAELKDLNGWKLEAGSFNSFEHVPYTLSMDIDALVAKHLKTQQENKDFQALIQQADNLYNQQNYIAAKEKYNAAKRDKKNEAYIDSRLKIIKDLIEKSDKKKVYDDLMQYAEEAKNRKDYAVALRNYQQAATLGQSDAEARMKASIMQTEIDNLKRKQEEDIASAKKQQDHQKDQLSADNNKEKNLLEAQKKHLAELEKVKAQNEALALKDLAQAERDQIEREQQARQKEREEEQRANEERKKQEREEKSNRRRAALDKRIRDYEEYMEYNPVQLKKYLDEARRLDEAALNMRPYEALNIKEDWWDRNGYMEDFRDDLNEPKRRAAYDRYFQLELEQASLYTRAENSYFAALANADKDSQTHDYIVRRIEFFNAMNDNKEEHFAQLYQNEQYRQEAQQRNKAIRRMQKMDLNAAQTARAFSSTHLVNAMDPNGFQQNGKLMADQYLLNNRINEAQQQNLGAKAITGAATGSVLELMTDGSKTAEQYGNNSMGFNVRLTTGYMGIPVMVNTTAEGLLPRSTPASLDVIPLIAEVDFWAWRNKYADIGLSGGGIFGVYPFEGYKNQYFQYHGTLKINAGSKSVKLALEGSLMQREGSYEVDRDVAMVTSGYELVPGQATGVMSEGKFDYGVLRMGGGLHIDFSDGDEKYVRLLCYADKPSFLKNPSFKDNIAYSYSAELLGGNGITIGFDYAPNYVVGGIEKYAMEHKNKAYWAIKFGKVFTLIKTK